MDQHGAGVPPAGDRGASSVEYALIVFAVAATVVAALMALGPPVYGLFDTTCQAVKGGASGPVACTEPRG
jgi:Flp pilus assembly pilin Flp